jgi:cyclic beta-1,2-glucan synthetase
MLNKSNNEEREQNDSFSEDSTSFVTEQLNESDSKLVKSYQNARVFTSKPGRKAVLGEDEIKLYSAWLEKAHTYFRETTNKGNSLTFASEWMLDNYYIITRTFQQISQDIPTSFYNQLPKLIDDSLKDLPRIYVFVCAGLSSQNYMLNLEDMKASLIKVQENVILTMGELWAFPIFLRYRLIQILAHVLVRVIQPENPPDLPILFTVPDGKNEPVSTINATSGDSSVSGIVANIILSLRNISEQDWNDFFESISQVEQILRQDPAGIYPIMDFKTRDMYRKEIELLSFSSGLEEKDISEIILNLASEYDKNEKEFTGISSNGIKFESPPFNLEQHVGHYLLGDSRPVLETKIGYHPNFKTAFKRWVMKHASTLYLGSILLIAFAVWLVILLVIFQTVNFQVVISLQKVSVLILLILLLVPIFNMSANLINWLITLVIKPHILPKLLFKEEIPEPFRTLVVIPAMITSRQEVQDLLRQLEMQYLRNPETGLIFALLTDFPDAASEILPEDEELIGYAAAVIEELNKKYNHSKNDDLTQSPDTDGKQLFYFLHRKRIWNPSEGCWMGWERKRGKLHELNLLLRGNQDVSFINVNPGSKLSDGLQNIRFVITLDADTILPNGAARRLVGTLAHPLNRARFDEKSGRVISGYTILQPRMEIHPRSSDYSWFTRIFAGDTGLDLYTRAVSDVYQDLFGEGIFVGKGIYDLDAFEKSTLNRIPENSVLSHDLLEGIMGRAGLVTDITLIENYPPNYYVQVKRQQRWIRGDWQLLPWLIQPGKYRIKFSAINRWKMFDNLNRSLLAPALILIYVLGIIFMPDLNVLWATVILLSLGIPLITSLARSTFQTLAGETIELAFQPLKRTLMRWLLALAFLPYEAYNALDAILTTLFRLLISRRDLLQWTTAAQTAHLFGLEMYRKTTWFRMMASAVGTLALIGLIVGYQYFIRGWAIPGLLIASPILLLWMLSPLLALWISHPIKSQTTPLSDEQSRLFRQLARRTWGFFERFVGPVDHWLPPDHFQETPIGIIAHRTSPSNIGLLLTSTLAAYDLGYLDQIELATRLTTTIDTLNQLERFRGHFLNWYDTQTLKPLNPRYVSTVDSGNLAASLIIITQACKKTPRDRIFRWAHWQGYLDTISNLTRTLNAMRNKKYDQFIEKIIHQIEQMEEEIWHLKTEPNRWYELYLNVNGKFWPDLSNQLIELIDAGRSSFSLDAMRNLQEVATQVTRHHQVIKRTITELVPWIPLFNQIPEFFKENQLLDEVQKLQKKLPYNPNLYKINVFVRNGLCDTDELRNKVKEIHSSQNSPEDAFLVRAALDWLDTLEQALVQAEEKAEALIKSFSEISNRAEIFVEDMDFKFLYHPQRRIFHIGLNLDVGELDKNYYDLLASEARIASIIALAKGDVPQSHWLHLGRPLTRVEGRVVLLSWSATMFEYLMPALFMLSYPGTLLSESAYGAVLHQIAYGKAKGVPWGISESGYYHFDGNQNYQYRAFGVPGLGFKRGLSDDLVVAPYASMIAIGYNPQAVAQNLVNLMEHEGMGLYGLYEAIDFTTHRLLVGEPSAVVHEYMAHHQGMILMAMANYFNKNIMVYRMHNDPRIQSVELLLQEQVSQSLELQKPFAEEVKGIQRSSETIVEVNPWNVPVHTSIPQVNLLSNGYYRVIISNMGGGYSSWRDLDLTRWQADNVEDSWGTWIYIQNKGSSENSEDSFAQGKIWSAGYQPISNEKSNMQVTYFAHKAVFNRVEENITSTMEITICPNDPVEIRLIRLHNTDTKLHQLRLTTYGEVILTKQNVDNQHSAFNKLFIETEFLPELNLQIFTRRQRSNEEPPVFMGHMVVVNKNGKPNNNEHTVYHEADRNRFIGRGRSIHNPEALTSDQYLTGSSGSTLDPILSLGIEIDVNPHDSTEMAFLTFAGDSRESILSLANRYSNWVLVENSFIEANSAGQVWLGKHNYNSGLFTNTMQIFSALLYPSRSARTSPETIAANKLGQSGLWRFGISGDYPIILVEVEDPKQIELVHEVLQVHEFLRRRGLMVDVVILNHQQTDYGAELSGMLYRLVNRLQREQWLNQRGGIFILYADQIKLEERNLLHTAGRSLVQGKLGSLSSQMPGYSTFVYHLPEFIPSKSIKQKTKTNKQKHRTSKESLQFFNGYGGFSNDGREYRIELPPGEFTPAPWVNVIGYQNFGFMVSETGSQSTWSENSGENRLTPWSNDPVCDPTGEALYLRDEETGAVWTPTPLPAGANEPYRVTHGAGYSIFEHNSHGLGQRLTLFARPEDPVKIIHLRVENNRNHTRRITATQYIEWVLGKNHDSSMPYIIPEYDAATASLIASNPFNTEFGERTAFLIASKQIHGLTADRTEFIGRGGTLAAPSGLKRIGLESRLTPGEDPCAVLQVHLDLLPGAVEEIYFVLGQGRNRDQSLELARKYHDPLNVEFALERTHLFWNQLLGKLQVHTPDPATDLILNHWMLYQSLSCRIWGRSAFYQSSGAFGFRDQLQDVLALLAIDPRIARDQILNAARHQFVEGDVLHWWHPPSGRGVRPRISDDLLWLPYVTAKYVEITGDMSILQEQIPFLEGQPLNQGENERYGEFLQTNDTHPLIEHCHRAIVKGATRGVHGLPLIGSGDWNDGMNRVGEEGKGESIWLAWFLCDVLESFADLCDSLGEYETAINYRARSKEYATAVEQFAWDGDWYRRAYYDDGTPLGSILEPECQIDSIAQSWSVLSGAGNPDRSRQAMQSVLERLIHPQERLSLLFTPPFNNTEHDPGYIKGYLPGIRENGGQYSHAATWTAWAFANLKDGRQAGELFDLLNPINMSDTKEKVSNYRVEPYVICADIYSQPPHRGRGGWTWYTGSAAWMYRLGLEGILGFKKTGNSLRIDPVIPPDWDGFEIRYQFGTASYFIKVINPEHVTHNVKVTKLDGEIIDNNVISLVDDGQEHNVEINMGASDL